MTTLELIGVLSVAIITSILGPIAVAWAKTKFSSKKDSLTKDIDASEQVQEQIEDLLDELNADRVWISMFHNGGHLYPTGKSLQKFSIMYETLGVGHSKSIKETFQNVPISVFAKTMGKLNKDGEIKASVKCQKGNFGLTAFLTEYGSKCLLMLALEDLQEHFIGMLTIEFAYDREEFSEDELIFITQKTSVIGTLLSTFVKK